MSNYVIDLVDEVKMNLEAIIDDEDLNIKDGDIEALAKHMMYSYDWSDFNDYICDMLRKISVNNNLNK